MKLRDYELTRPPYFQADNRQTHTASVKIYNPDSVPASTQPQRAHCAGRVRGECVHRVDGIRECLCKDSERTQ